jgi:perosamine synthetase
MIVTNDAQIAERCRSWRNQGRDGERGWLRHSTLGYNYRLSDLHCALGLAQLERIEELLRSRARVAGEYRQAFEAIPGIILPPETSDNSRSWFAYVIQVAGESPAGKRDRLMAGLRARGIACQAYFPPIHQQPYFREIKLSSSVSLPQTELSAQRCLALPFFPAMTNAQVAEVSAAVSELLSEELGGSHSEQKHFSASAGSRQ